MRSMFWDGWKGLAILAVVAIHASGEAETFPRGSFNWYFGVVFRQLVNFAVPLFLALAGYFATASPAASGWAFYKSRLRRLLPPYLFWTAVFVLLKQPEHLISPTELTKDVLLGTGIGIGYFVIVLVQFILITPLILKIRRDWQHLLLMGVISVPAMIVSYELRLNHPDSPMASFPLAALPFVMWYPFYHLGVYAAQRQQVAEPFLRNKAGWLGSVVLAGVAAAVFEAVYLAGKGYPSVAVSQIKATSFLASIAMFVFVLGQAWSGRTAFGQGLVTWLGRHSYIVYLTHLLFLPPVAWVLRRFPAIHDWQPVFLLLSVLLTLAACLALIRLLRWVVPVPLRRDFLGA